MQPFADTLPSELKKVDVNIMYATDRVTAPRFQSRSETTAGLKSIGMQKKPSPC